MIVLLMVMTTSVGPGANSWPIATYHQFMVRRTTMVDCAKAQALLDWLVWTQTSPEALDLAIKYDPSRTPWPAYVTRC
jgi:hypothetical protein